MHMTRPAVIPRLLQRPDRSFFLFGPRGTGKSTWLKQVLPDAFRLDLLDASLFLELSRDPHRLEALVSPRPAGSWVVLDEVQKVPALLDEAGCRTVRCDVVPVSGLEKNPLSGKVERFIPLNEE